jgi:hypothetical protein
MKKRFGDRIAPLEVRTILGAAQLVPDSSLRFTHLQFRRWIGCPICNDHIARFRRHHDRIAAAGIREVMFFHSTPEEILAFDSTMPFEMVGDAERVYYRQFGVERGWLFLASWRAIAGAARGFAAGKYTFANARGIDGLPADILLSDMGVVLAAHYGEDAADHWSVDELIATARAAEQLHPHHFVAKPAAAPLQAR